MNHRRDQWGGSLENRGRILIRIIEESRRLVGAFPLMVKINGSETRKKGVRPLEAARLARLLEAAGCDAVEVSCGIAEDGFNTVRVPKAPAEAMVNFLEEFKHLPGPVKWCVQRIAPFFTAIPGPITNYNVTDGATIKKQVNIPVIAVGGIRNRSDMENIIQEGGADFVAMARPFIIEPGIVEKFKTGRALESKCINCGYCLLGVTTNPLRCYYGKVR